MIVDDTNIILTSGNIFNNGFNPVVFTTYNTTQQANTRKSNRLTNSEVIDNVLDYPFSKTRYNSVVSTLRKGKVQVYHDSTFLINSVILEFIRKPRKVNINLNISCDLNPNVHEKVIDLAVERTAAILQAGNLKELMKNNQNLE